MNNNVILNIELTPAEADEVIAGLNNHASSLEGLAQKILISAQGQYAKIIADQQKAAEEATKDNKEKKGENK